MSLLIAYASMSGNSEFLAGEVHGQLTDALGDAATLVHLDALGWETLTSTARALFVIPTWGSGEVPVDAEALYDRLRAPESSGALDGLEFGLIAPGDRAYEDFCGGGKRFAEALKGAGATEAFSALLLDGNPIEQHLDVVAKWVEKLPWLTPAS